MKLFSKSGPFLIRYRPESYYMFRHCRFNRHMYMYMYSPEVKIIYQFRLINQPKSTSSRVFFSITNHFLIELLQSRKQQIIFGSNPMYYPGNLELRFYFIHPHHILIKTQKRTRLLFLMSLIQWTMVKM